MKKTATLASAGFLACILLANFVTSRYGMIPVGFGILATAGTYFAGASFVLRDAVQDTGGRKLAVVVIVTGAVLSFAISAPFIALASAVAFLFSETADFAVYQPLRKRGYLRAATASNVVGAIVDTFVFLTIAGFPVRQAFAGQMLGKLMVTAAVVAVVFAVREGLRGYRTAQA